MNLILVLLAAAIAAVLVWTWRSRAVATRSADAQVVAQLADAGSDLARPHPIEFFLYFPSEDAARRALAELADPRYEADLARAATGERWLLRLTRSMPPVAAELEALRAAFRRLAARHGGEYDGWGTPVVPG